MNPKPPLVDQPTAAPTRKVAAGGIGASAGAIVGWAAVALLIKSGVPLPPEIQGEVYSLAVGLTSTAAGFISAYLTRERARVETPSPLPPSVDGPR